MKGTNSKDVDVIHFALQEYYNNIPIGELGTYEAEVFDRVMLDGGIVCDDTLDSTILKIQQEYVDGDTTTKDAKIQELINILITNIVKFN